MIQNDFREPVDLTFRPRINLTLFYSTSQTIETIQNINGIETSNIEQRAIGSVEEVVSVKRILIRVTIVSDTVGPPNAKMPTWSLEELYFDYMSQYFLPGDFRFLEDKIRPEGSYLPSPESLLIPPKFKFHEGQKWSIRMIYDQFQIDYELVKVDYEQYLADVNGTNGTIRICNGPNKRWNATWTVNIHTGVIKQMDIEIEEEDVSNGSKKRIHSAKELINEEPSEEASAANEEL
ncbi:unnamed protein product [Adineta steineri]|uniref:Uncharacterized protein n=1 Tax=Adineta steineri TaxID=433720 RepID=A0A815E7J0_9BILA|nr:unnamed protein product [Adineta steineri]CAF3685125.1 unnamed protein product [Adineta steineri]